MRTTIIIIALLSSLNLYGNSLKVINLLCERKTNPIGIDTYHPSFSWMLSVDYTAKNIMQTAYEIQVAASRQDLLEEKNLLWNPGQVPSDQTVHIPYQGEKLVAKHRYYWRVKVWDNQNGKSNWSEPSYFETGLMGSDKWKAQWIEAQNAENKVAPMFRKAFEAENGIKKARLYITSRGLYKVSLNNHLVTDAIFTPGWTSYNKRIQYQVYDVTNLIKPGKNATGVILADGWYRGGFFEKRRGQYGDKLALLYQLEIEYNNGRMQTISSNDTWKSIESPYKLASIYDGVLYDARQEIDRWDMPDLDDRHWEQSILADYPTDNLVASTGEEVKRIEEIKAVKHITTPKGENVIDFGQNLTGRIRFHVTGDKGDTITLMHAEVLDSHGNFYTDNLRTAKQKVRYIFKDNKPVVFEPDFTFQGFRYIKVTDYHGSISKENFSAIVIHSDMEPTIHFDCSDARVNQLHSNIKWGMRGNFLDIPTDCPQRDERCGWTGDVQVFCSTSNYLYNTAAFYSKWLQDVKAEQREDGAIPHIVPKTYNGYGSTGWGDVATILPYQLYLTYGDQELLASNFEMMKGWVDYLTTLRDNNKTVTKGKHLGDWLFYIHPTDWNDKPGYTDTDLISTAFLAHSASLVAESAKTLGKNKDAEKYQQLFNTTKQAFINEYMTPSGRLSSNTQTAYVLALAFDLIPENKIKAAVTYLVDNIQRRGYHLSTGFLGTPYLCRVLSENGANDVAYKLLLQDSYPSWIYPITKGATTVWERWDGIKPNGQFQTDKMNSFNHYAYGAIGSWLYAYVAGIQPDINKPGYKHILIKPMPDSSLSYAKATYNTLYGTVSSSWEMNDNQFSLSVSIPANTTASVHLPFTNKIEELGSGSYSFNYNIK